MKGLQFRLSIVRETLWDRYGVGCSMGSDACPHHGSYKQNCRSQSKRPELRVYNVLRLQKLGILA